MSEKKSVIDTLGDYITQVFDTDGDGIVTIKELLAVFPNMAIPIAILFVDILVMVAEYRVWQFGVFITKDPLLAVGFVLVSAVPFLLGQLFWLYPRAVLPQKIIAVSFIGMSLYTSANFGLADLTKEYNQNDVFQFLVQLTIFYIVGTLIYIIIDPTIKANRTKKIAQDAAKWQIEKNGIANAILTSLQEGLAKRKELERSFGADEVEKILHQLSGKKSVAPQNQLVPMRTFPQTTENPTKAERKQEQPPRESNETNRQ